MKGSLYLLPSFLGGGEADDVFPGLNLKTAGRLRHFIVEDERTARRFLKKIQPSLVIDELSFFLLNEHTRDEEIIHYLDPAMEGLDIGLLSEAGMPCIADPGAWVVRMAHELGVRVIPLIGPSSIMLSLAASGMNGQSFAFHGYLPIDKPARSRRLKELESAARRGQTQIFIETPYRNNAMLEAVIQSCQPATMLCVACDISLETEMIRTQSVATWKSAKADLHKRPAIFLLGQ